MTKPVEQFEWPFNTEHPDVARVRHQQALELAETSPLESQRLLESALRILAQCSHACGQLHPKLFEVAKEFRRSLERSGMPPDAAERQADVVIENAKAEIPLA